MVNVDLYSASSLRCVPGGLFTLKVIPALFGFAFEITISRLQTWSDVIRCGPMGSDVVISHTRTEERFNITRYYY